MRKLSRQRLGQISASSDPEIFRDLKRAEVEMSDLRVVGEPMENAQMLNAWCWGLARLPADVRRAVTEVLVRDLERWMLEQRTYSPEQLLEAIRGVLCSIPVVEDDPVVRRKSGRVGRPSGDHGAAREFSPRPSGAKR